MPSSLHLRRLPNLLAALVAAMLAVLALASPALAGGGDDNVAAEVNTQDGSSQIDISFDIEKVMDGIVDQTNAAVAFSSCEECQTIAIAIQVVLVSGAVDVLAPTNVSYAVNADCTTCVTVALAYQLVLGDLEGLRLTDDARRRLAAIAKAFRDLERSGGSVDDVIAETNRLLNDVTDVLATGFEPIHRPREEKPDGQRPGDGSDDEDADARPESTPTPEDSPTPEATEPPESGGTGPAEPADPTATPTPAPTSTPTPPASATPTPSVTSEPSPTPTP